MIVFDNEQLVPAPWRHLLRGGPVRVFNPGLLRDGDDRWILAYRVVFEADRLRRIALCRLDQKFAPVVGSAVPYSDEIVFEQPTIYAEQALTWFADPRLYRLNGRTYIYWNSGWHEPSNTQFLQEFDTGTLRPVAAPRELQLVGTRQPLEKNWALFEAEEGVYAVYSVNPFRILSVPLRGSGPIRCEPLAAGIPNAGGFAQAHGGLRGGAPPCRDGDRFWSFCHAIEDAADGYAYVAAAFTFHVSAPFPVAAMPNAPLRITIPEAARRKHPKLNPAVGSVIYPSGAAKVGSQWVLSIGIDDERSALVFVPADEAQATLNAEANSA